LASGPWAVQVTRNGRYRFDLYRWPKHLNQAMKCKHARLKLGKLEVEQDVSPNATHARFEVDLQAGPAMLQTWLTNDQYQQHGAYFVWVERL